MEKTVGYSQEPNYVKTNDIQLKRFLVYIHKGCLHLCNIVKQIKLI